MKYQIVNKKPQQETVIDDFKRIGNYLTNYDQSNYTESQKFFNTVNDQAFNVIQSVAPAWTKYPVKAIHYSLRGMTNALLDQKPGVIYFGEFQNVDDSPTTEQLSFVKKNVDVQQYFRNINKIDNDTQQIMNNASNYQSISKENSLNIKHHRINQSSNVAQKIKSFPITESKNITQIKDIKNNNSYVNVHQRIKILKDLNQRKVENRLQPKNQGLIIRATELQKLSRSQKNDLYNMKVNVI